jgi:hypothetical protein
MIAHFRERGNGLGNSGGRRKNVYLMIGNKRSKTAFTRNQSSPFQSRSIFYPISLIFFVVVCISISPPVLADLSGSQADYLGWQLLDSYHLAKPIIFIINFFILLYAILLWKYYRNKIYAFLLVSFSILPFFYAFHVIRTYLAYLSRWQAYANELHPWELWILKSPLYLAMILFSFIFLINVLHLIMGKQDKAPF